MKRPFFFIFWLIFAIVSVPLLWYLGVIQGFAFMVAAFSGVESFMSLEYVSIFSLGGFIFLAFFFLYLIYSLSTKNYQESNLVNWKVWQKILYIVFIALSVGVVLAGIWYAYMFVSALANLGCNPYRGCDNSIVKFKIYIFAGYCGFVWCVAVFFAIQSCFKRSK